jgi:hypothetical protein
MERKMTTGAARVSKSTEAAIGNKEAMIRAILDVLDRTWTQAESPGSLQRMEEFFRKLDEPTLRAIGYQHGVFESELEPEESEDRTRSAPGD